jgi:hypothetical protein
MHVLTWIFSLLTIAVVTSAVVARTIPGPTFFSVSMQQALQSTKSLREMTMATAMSNATVDDKKVPGDNPAYYSGSTPRNQQLFDIAEFDLVPNPPVL